MKNTVSEKRLKQFFLLFGALFILIALASCEKDDPAAPDPIASFQFEVSESNFLEVVFSNFSQHATSYSWDFGDGSTSTEENPTHVYAEVGDYTVVLTAKNEDEVSAEFTRTLEVRDPDEALTLLAGTTSKTWKLYRVGTALGVGENVDNPRGWWSLSNEGLRPCIYFHEFTFHRNGAFVFDDKGSFWGEEAVFGGTDVVATCFEAVSANMVNSDGVNVSAWLGGTHAFEYNSNTSMVTLNGNGAWLGLPQLTTEGENITPVSTKTFKITIEEHEGFDLMIVLYEYDWGVWEFSYASYSDPSLEPDVVLEYDPGDDLPNYTPAEMFNTFASTDEADVKYLVPTDSDVTITPGTEDPANAAADKVGKYQRGTSQYADLKFQMDFNIQFDNFTKVSLDVYVPSTNDYSGGLDKSIMIWIADASTTTEFWTSWVQYLVKDEDVVTNQWVTYTFNLDEPSEGSTGNPKTREDLDLVGLTIGAGGHTVDATFYIRNFRFH